MTINLYFFEFTKFVASYATTAGAVFNAYILHGLLCNHARQLRSFCGVSKTPDTNKFCVFCGFCVRIFFLSSHARGCGKGCGDSREDGDYHVEDFTPESVVVESSHFK